MWITTPNYEFWQSVNYLKDLILRLKAQNIKLHDTNTKNLFTFQSHSQGQLPQANSIFIPPSTSWNTDWVPCCLRVLRASVYHQGMKHLSIYPMFRDIQTREANISPWGRVVFYHHRSRTWWGGSRRLKLGQDHQGRKASLIKWELVARSDTYSETLRRNTKHSLMMVCSFIVR